MNAVSILVAFKNHKLDKIMFRTNLDHFEGKYWKRSLKVLKFNETIAFNNIARFVIFAVSLVALINLHR